jgi:hypothetical protein
MGTRKRTSTEVERAVLTRSLRRCCICFVLNGIDKQRRGQIAHLDHDRSHSDFENLAFLCLNHHDEYDGNTSQSKGLTVEEVRAYRDQLYSFNESRTVDARLKRADDAIIKRLVDLRVEGEKILAAIRVISGEVCRPFLIVHRGDDGYARKPDRAEIDQQ